MTSALAGKRVVVTRERPGELGAMLEARGATVVHVPLIEIQEPTDGGERFRRELAGLRNFDWLVVTSVPGAERVGRAAAETRRTALAAVGSATARVLADLAGRPVDLLPSVQRAETLADLLIERCRTRRDSVRGLSHRVAPTGPLDGGRRGRARAGERFLGAGLGRCVRRSD